MRYVAALARLGEAPADDYDATLTKLLERVKDDEEARQEFVDILELLGPERSPDGELPAPADQPAVLTAAQPMGVLSVVGPRRSSAGPPALVGEA